MQDLGGLRAILLGTALSAAHVAAIPPVAEPHQADPHLAGPSNCQFLPPDEWRDTTLTWDGSCLACKAHGLGVLRAYKHDASTQLFFGNLEYGELRLGVIEVADGYIAGQFAQGKLVPGAERNVIINAFRNAGAAAKAYSQRLEQAGNHGSAVFYLKKAQELEQQMD